MRYLFKSFLADDIESYLELRQSLGNERATFARRLHSFDAFCVDQYPDTKILTKEIAESWCTLRNDEKETTLMQRITILRGFAKYLCSIEKPAYVLPYSYSCRRQSFVPYLYGTSELKKFFYGADHLPPHPLSPHREYIAPVLFRILYCCGLRPQEVRWLNRQHVNLNEGTLFIEASKQNKDRVVAMFSELTDLCRKYDIIMQTKLPERKYFFQNPNGSPYTASWIQNQFFRCWRTAGFSFGSNHRPRVYDWRHNFATNVITKWMKEKRNVSALLPYLSTYMGHASLEYTAYYIHLVPEHLCSSGITDWNCNLEVPDYED